MRDRLPMLLSITALLVAVLGATPLGKAAYEAAVPRNSVGTLQLKNSAVTTKKLAGNAVNSAKVQNGSLLASDFKAGQLPAGPTGPQGPPGAPGLSAIETVNAVSPSSSATTRAISKQCPAGKRLLGGGANLGGNFTTVAIQRSFPDNDNTWTATAREITPNAGSWTLTAYAVCGIAAS